MRIVVIGAGALGSLCAACLSWEGQHEVWMLGGESSRAHLEAIAEYGLKLELAPAIAAVWPPAPLRSADQPELYTLKNLRVASAPEQIAGPVDLAIILVKSYQTERAAQQAATFLSPTGLALTLQNGLGNVEVLAARLGAERVTQGVTMLGGILIEPGRARFNALMYTSLGLRPGLTPSAVQRLHEFAELFSGLNLPTEVSTEIDSFVWGKLVINCAVNPLTALLNCSIGTLQDDPNIMKLLEEAAFETAKVAAALAVKLPYPPEEAPARVRQAVKQAAANTSSMVLDVRHNRPTEIDAINGEIIRYGEQVGIATPVNRSLYFGIKKLLKSE